MIKNLIVSGCSFTDSGAYGSSWAEYTANHLGLNCINLAKSGAGNDYIANSIIDTVYSYNPEETIVIVMWSGPGRKDLVVSSEYWETLQYPYKTKTNWDEDKHYVFSGGMANSWLDNPDAKKLFYFLYKSSDPYTFTKNTLLNFLNLENSLVGYKFKFTSFINFWDPNIESGPSGDYSLGHFGPKLQIYDRIKFNNWFFVDEKRNGFYEFAKKLNLLSEDDFHPDITAHKKFAEEIVIPNIQEFLK